MAGRAASDVEDSTEELRGLLAARPGEALLDRVLGALVEGTLARPEDIALALRRAAILEKVDTLAEHSTWGTLAAGHRLIAQAMHRRRGSSSTAKRFSW